MNGWPEGSSNSPASRHPAGHRICCYAILEYNRTGGKTVGGSGKLEFEKDCEFDDIAGEYVLWRY